MTKSFNVGDRVLWTDPECPDESPIPATVVKVCGEVILCVFDNVPNGYGEVEAFAHELKKKEQ